MKELIANPIFVVKKIAQHIKYIVRPHETESIDVTMIAPLAWHSSMVTQKEAYSLL